MEDLRELKNIALRNRVFIIGAMVFLAIGCIAFVLWYKPTIRINTEELIAKENARQAIEKQNAVLHELVLEQSRSLKELAQKDSALLAEVMINGEDIKKIKIKTNETIERFNHFTSTEWTRYFAALPEGQ